MDAGQPSRTALATAAARAAHLVVDREPRIFEDRLAARLLGNEADQLVAAHHEARSAAPLGSMRVAMTTRSRYCEDRLLEAARRGVAQYVILGAGLDSFAYRSPLLGRLCVFEVDHPATQAWKRQRLADAAISIPDQVRFVAVDLAVDSLAQRLLDTGFDPSRPAFVSWLGVTQYLTEAAIGATLDVIAGFCPGTQLVIEYLVPTGIRDEAGEALADFFMPRAASVAEPWLTFLAPADVAGLLAARDMAVVDDVGRREQIDPQLWTRSDQLRPHKLGRVARAVVEMPAHDRAPPAASANA
jgi:methyltransferase (TIGR00027 family)